MKFTKFIKRMISQHNFKTTVGYYDVYFYTDQKDIEIVKGMVLDENWEYGEGIIYNFNNIKLKLYLKPNSGSFHLDYISKQDVLKLNMFYALNEFVNIFNINGKYKVNLNNFTFVQHDIR